MNPLHWLSRPESAALATALAHFLWQGTLVALLLAALVRMFSIQRAAQRYACSLAALVAMAACPAVTFLVVGSRVTPPDGASTQGVASGLAADMEPPVVVPSARWQLALDAAAEARPFLLAFWLAGVCALGLRLSGGVVGVFRLSRQNLPLPLDLARRVERLGAALQVEALPRVFLSRCVGEALAIGLWRPIVLVPAAWASEMPLSVLEAVIAHELAHIRRLDLWVNLFQRVVETLLFYHPAVWWVSRRLSQEREMCCDELAVGATGQKVAYVEALERVARERLAGVRPALAAGICGESNMKLLARVRNVLGGPACESFGLWPAGLLALLLPLGLWGVTWGVFGPSPAAASAADNHDDVGAEEDEERGVDAALRGFFLSRGEDSDDEDDEGEGRKKVVRKEADDPAPKKERPDGDARKKAPRDGSDPKPRKEGDQPKKVIRDSEKPGKEGIKKELREREDGEPGKKRIPTVWKEQVGEQAELAAMIIELRGEIELLRAEVRELREGKAKGGQGASGKVKDANRLERLESEAREEERSALSERREEVRETEERAEERKYRDDDKEKLLEAIRSKVQAAERDAAERKKLEAKKREALDQKLREAARDKERAADREAAERKERQAKERAAIERKERESADSKESDREQGLRRK